MNKTTDIHLAKTLFSLDETAYKKLKNYLDQLELLFNKTDGAKDILEDIEARIAELFTERKADERSVIAIEDVEEVILTLGKPEDLIDDENEETATDPLEPKKLFRDPDDRFLGGVSGGLGHYFGIDSVWIRLVFLILFFSSIGGVLLVYVLLWILIPEAKTTADKLKMKGEPVNVSNIKKKIKEELEQVSTTVKDIDYEGLEDKLKKKSKTFSDFVLQAAKVVLKIAALLIGIVILIFSGLTLLGLSIGTIVGSIFGALIPHEMVQLGLSLDIPFLAIGLFTFLIIGIPLVFLFTLGLRLIAQNKRIMGKTSRIVLGGLWLASLFILIGFGVYETKSFAIKAKNSHTESWEAAASDTLKIYLNDEKKYTETVTLFNNYTIITDESGDNYRLDKDIRLHFGVADKQEIQLTIDKTAHGWNQKKALENAQSIRYQYDYYDNQLVLDANWISPAEQKISPQDVRITLYVPDGKLLYIDTEMSSLLGYDIKNDQDYYRKRIAGHLWKMEKGVLVCQDCTPISGQLQIDESGVDLNLINQKNRFEVTLNEKGLKVTKKQNESGKE